MAILGLQKYSLHVYFEHLESLSLCQIFLQLFKSTKMKPICSLSHEDKYFNSNSQMVVYRQWQNGLHIWMQAASLSNTKFPLKNNPRGQGRNAILLVKIRYWPYLQEWLSKLHIQCELKWPRNNDLLSHTTLESNLPWCTLLFEA